MKKDPRRDPKFRKRPTCSELKSSRSVHRKLLKVEKRQLDGPTFDDINPALPIIRNMP